MIEFDLGAGRAQPPEGVGPSAILDEPARGAAWRALPINGNHFIDL